LSTGEPEHRALSDDGRVVAVESTNSSPRMLNPTEIVAAVPTAAHGQRRRHSGGADR
jgi:hypothetical protein